MTPESKGDLVLVVDGNSVPDRCSRFAAEALQKRGYWVLLIIVSADQPFTIQDLTRLEPADKQELIYLVKKAMHVSV